MIPEPLPSVLRSTLRLLTRAGSARPGADDRVAPATPPGLPERFVLQEHLGHGGMGTVYRAYDRESGHDVAVKMLHGVSPHHRLELKREFRAQAGIVHPNLVSPYDLVIGEHACFFTMELVRGVNLVEHFRQLASATPAHSLQLAFRDCARQLALGLIALHEARKLHRDVKPANVLVTPAGRVVLLDFGLLTSLVPESDSGQGPAWAGTIPYMAPEQRLGKGLAPAADWYSFGATLYEAISGHLPISPNAAWQSLTAAPVRLKARGCEVSAELDDLIARLLLPSAEQRPVAEEILACLGGGPLRPTLATAPAPAPSGEALVGRERELERLAAGLAESERGQCRMVHVFGPSGIGKSTLVRTFLSQVEERQGAEVLVLRSRCHPQEALAYNAIDGLIDQLARWVVDLGEGADGGLTSEQHRALLRVFPVLAQALRPQQDESSEPSSDEREQRRVALVALREVLSRLSQKRRLILWVDDAQWGDRDSGTVLLELLRHRDRLPLLLILSYREQDRETSACLSVLDQGLEDRSAFLERLRLLPLSEEHSARLVDDLLLGPGGPAAGARRRDQAISHLVAEAAGSPFLLGELCRYVATRPDLSAARNVTLDQMLGIRIGELPAEARGLVEVCAVAGSPLEQGVALRAAGLGADSRALVAGLEHQSVLRTADFSRRTVEVYHDKIRGEVLRSMPAQATSRMHSAIATALLETRTPNPLAALDHFEAAGDHAAVRRYIIAAAAHASNVLAFDRAADLYRRAIELRPSDLSESELCQRLGDALGNAGRGKEAAQAFLRAAEVMRAEGESTPDRSIHLRQRAAEQFIQTGYYREGTSTLFEVVSDLNVALPRSRSEALRRAAMLRLTSLLTRPSVSKSRRRPASALELRRYDALSAAGMRLSMIDFALPSYISARCAREVRRIGEPSRMIQALSLEGAYCATIAGKAFQARARRLLELAGELLRDRTSGSERSYWHGAYGVVEFYAGNYTRCIEQLEAASHTGRSASRERRWLETNQKHWTMYALQLLGEVGELVRRVRRAEDEPDAEEDRYAALFAGFVGETTAWLALDAPSQALERAERALSLVPSHYTVQHLWHFNSVVEVELYRGDPLAAWKLTQETWDAHRENFMLNVQFARDVLLFKRGQAALGSIAMLQAGRADRIPGGFDVHELRRDARASANTIERHALPQARGSAHVLRAKLAQLEGDHEAARSRLQAAVAAYDEVGMALSREAARFGLGQISRGDPGEAQMRRATAWMREQSIVDPAKMARSVTADFAAPPRLAGQRAKGS